MIALIYQTLISYAVVYYVMYTTGPFNVFDDLREAAGVDSPVIDDDGEVSLESDGSFLGDIFDCHRCLTPYVSLLVLAILLLMGVVPISAEAIAIYLGGVGATLFLLEVST